MAQYINKSALVAEIEKRIEETKGMQPQFDQFWAGQISAFKGVLKILDTLEVKEVDLEKENLPISNSLTEEGLFTFKDGGQAIIKRLNTGGSSE